MMNTSWHDLISLTSSDNIIKGEWFVIRLMPDIIKEEVFNVGVVFIDQSKNCHFKLIENSNVFKLLFGTNGLENINFLLDNVNDLLKANQYLSTPSPNIIYSSLKTAQGESIEEILNDLYDSMISLAGCK